MRNIGDKGADSRRLMQDMKYKDTDLKYEIFEICNNIDLKPKLE